MKTIYKLILKSYLGPMFLTFFIVMFVLLLHFMWLYIDELVGKGIGLSVILELMWYVSATMIPMALPLATLLAAIMTMGNMGENYELLAMKSAGMSLPRIMKPLIIVVGVIALGSFFASNNLVPFATKKMFALLYDMRQQNQNIEFKDGLFFNGIDRMSIRVGKQDPQTSLLTDILIYDTRSASGNMTTTVADSGYIRLSDDKKFLQVNLYHGETYEYVRDYSNWYTNSTLRRSTFDGQQAVIPMSGFDFERTDMALFSDHAQTQNMANLAHGIDSLKRVTDETKNSSYTPVMQNYLFAHDLSLVFDSIPKPKRKARFDVAAEVDSLTLNQKNQLYEQAIGNSQNARNSHTFEEISSKDALARLYHYEIEWYNKLSLPVSILIFFLIGAPLGAIIRKGGLGMPIVVSVLFFVVYYIIMMTGQKMAREGTWTAFTGVWISTFILLPLSLYLTYKATNDSNLFNADWYYAKLRKIRVYVKFLFNLKQYGKGEKFAK